MLLMIEPDRLKDAWLLFTPAPDLGIMLKLKKMLYTTNRQKVQNCG